MSIYNRKDFNKQGEFVELPYLQRNYATKALLTSSISAVNGQLMK